MICVILRNIAVWHSFSSVYGFYKVVVPAVYSEWEAEGVPEWVRNETFQKQLNYTIFLYQKSNSSKPNFVSTNRGCENGVYYQYIVDHYYSFPDVAIFTHAFPAEHSPNWLDMVSCVRPNATYMSLNLGNYMCRESWIKMWRGYGIWLEQCLRDTLQLILGNITTTELNKVAPPQKPLLMCTHCCQQFLVRWAIS